MSIWCFFRTFVHQLIDTDCNPYKKPKNSVEKMCLPKERRQFRLLLHETILSISHGRTQTWWIDACKVTFQIIWKKNKKPLKVIVFGKKVQIDAGVVGWWCYIRGTVLKSAIFLNLHYLQLQHSVSRFFIQLGVLGAL